MTFFQDLKETFKDVPFNQQIETQTFIEATLSMLPFLGKNLYIARDYYFHSLPVILLGKYLSIISKHLFERIIVRIIMPRH